MTGGPTDDDDERTQFIAQPAPPPRPPASEDDEDDEDERTQFLSAPSGAAALAGGTAGGPLPSDDERTQFLGQPAAADPGHADPGHPAPGPEAPYVPEILRGDPGQTDQPTSTGAFPQSDPTYVAPPPPVSQPARPTAAAGATATPIGVGTIINNNYRIEQVLKSGGMGSVFRGVNIHTEDPVAIKVILPELAEDEKVGLMFKREARTLGQLQDDAIVRYYNYVYDPDLGGYCLVMEFISGVPLSDHTGTHGPVTVEAGKVLLRRLAKGLQKAHDQDVVHRDLSPDNVMLPDGIVAEAVLIDFGIAKSNVVKEGTMAGQFAGKFKYVAPEQLGHYGGEIGPRADIYSLALLMAAAVTGKPIDMGSSIVEAVQSRQAIPDLSEIPPDLRPILTYMLEPDPENRPESMSRIVELMDHPEQIPQTYRDGLPLPNTALPSSGTTTRTFSPVNQMVQGLQAPPSPMHVGGNTVTGATIPPTDGGRGLGFVMPLIVLLALGGAGAALYATVGADLLAGLGGGAPPAPEATEPEQGLAARAENTREGFLAEYAAGDCVYATRLTDGPEAGRIAGLATTPGVFANLPTAYEDQFGTRPAIAEKTVTQAQCPALDFARALQGRILEPVEMTLDKASAEGGQMITGQLTDREERRIWMALVSPQGGVFNLTPSLATSVGGVRRFSFQLNPVTADTPQLILAVASEESLIRTAASRDGAQAEGLLPLILREIEGNGGTAAATLGHILLTPPAPAPPAAEGNPDQ